jgi:hypothetical protein
MKKFIVKKKEPVSELQRIAGLTKEQANKMKPEELFGKLPVELSNKIGKLIKPKETFKGEALKSLSGVGQVDKESKGQLDNFTSIINKLINGTELIKIANKDKGGFSIDIPSDYSNLFVRLFSKFKRGEKITQNKFDDEVLDVIKEGDRNRRNATFFKKHKDDLISYFRSIPSIREIERKTNSKEEFNYIIGKLQGMHGRLRQLKYKK